MAFHLYTVTTHIPHQNVELAYMYILHIMDRAEEIYSAQGM